MDLFDETYSGPRWTYGLTYRPLGYSNVPPGWIIGSDRKHSQFRYGTVDYPYLLADGLAHSFDLTFTVRERRK